MKRTETVVALSWPMESLYSQLHVVFLSYGSDKGQGDDSGAKKKKNKKKKKKSGANKEPAEEDPLAKVDVCTCVQAT